MCIPLLSSCLEAVCILLGMMYSDIGAPAWHAAAHDAMPNKESTCCTMFSYWPPCNSKWDGHMDHMHAVHSVHLLWTSRRYMSGSRS